MRPCPTTAIALGVILGSIAGCVTDPPVHAPADIYGRLLRAYPPKLEVQVSYVEGREPADLALRTLGHTLRNVTSKGEILIRSPEAIPAQELRTADPAAYRAVSDQFFTGDRSEDTAVIHVLYLDRCMLMENGECAAGMALQHSQVPLILIFLDTLSYAISTGDATSPRVSLPGEIRDQFERAILIHELGHVLGLVNNGVPMVRPHEDEAHPHHSDNPESVMYWQIEDPNRLATYIPTRGIVPFEFDENDLADLRAHREA